MATAQKEISINILDLLLMLAKRKWLLVLNTILFVAAAVTISLVLPVEYLASVVLMPPSTVVGDTDDLLKSLSLNKLSGGLLPSNNAGPEEIYLAILNSRAMQIDVINKFNLTQYFGFTKRKRYYIEDVMKKLEKKVTYKVSDVGTVVISVQDTSARLTADMANYMAQKLDDIYRTLKTETAKGRRVFLESRLDDINKDLEKSESAYAEFQKKNKMIDLEYQTKATIEAASNVQSHYLSTLLQLNIDRKNFGSGNPKIIENEKDLLETKKLLNKMATSRDFDLMIPLGSAPDLALEFIKLKRAIKVQELLFQIVTEQFEAAKLEEVKTTPRVQVLDKAEVPQKKKSPKRSMIVIAAFFASLVFGAGFVTFAELFSHSKRENTEDYRKLAEIVRTLFSIR
jgi:tyrosine-protein kinase Etk/Wzc